jgi:glutathione S-transferase
LGDKQATPLWPNDPKARADIMRWQSWHLQHWSRGVNGFVFENLVKSILRSGDPDPRALAQAGELFHQDAAALEKHLAHHPYLVNDTLTLADFTVVAPLFLAERAKIPLERYANIRRWFGAQAALLAWTQTAPRP